MDFRETHEHQMLRESVRKIVSEFGPEYYVKQARADGRLTELWRALGEAGFMGVNTPEAYGGSGLGIYELHVVLEEASALGCPLLLMLVSPAICATIISKFGSDAMKNEWLPPMAEGKSIMAFADGDNYVLNGTKYYISGADEADAILVVARTAVDDQTGRGKLSLFVVDSNAPGLEKQPIPMEFHAPEKQFTLFFNDCKVPAARLIGTEHDGLKQVFMGLNPERIMGAALTAGIGRYALEKASRYANERQVWKTPIGTHQGLAHPLAECKIQLELARLMVQKASSLYDAGADAAEAANMAKFAAADSGLACLDQAIQTHGGNGMSQEYGLANLWGMCRTLRIAPVSREMILNYVAGHSLGLPRSY